MNMLTPNEILDSINGCPDEPIDPTQVIIDSSCDDPVHVTSCDPQLFVSTFCDFSTKTIHTISTVVALGGTPITTTEDTGIVCDPTQPIPQDPEKVRYCNADTGTFWDKICVFQFDQEDVTIPPTLIVLSDTDSGVDCVSTVVRNDREYVCNTVRGFYDQIDTIFTDNVAGEPVITETDIPCGIDALKDYEIKPSEKCDPITQTIIQSFELWIDGVKDSDLADNDTLIECNKCNLCDKLDELTDVCEVCTQTLQMTYATIAYTITGVTLGGVDVSSNFTLPVNGNNAPEFNNFKSELEAYLVSVGYEVTTITGRDGFTMTWVGDQIEVQTDGTPIPSAELCEEVKTLRTQMSKCDRDFFSAFFNKIIENQNIQNECVCGIECDICSEFTVCVRGFDYQEIGTWDALDDTMRWEVYIDGVLISTSTDSITTQDNGMKSSWYANLIANVNTTSWSMVVASDAVSTTSDKPTFSITGPQNEILQLVRLDGTSGDTLTISYDSGSSNPVVTFENGGGDIASDLIQQCS